MGHRHAMSAVAGGATLLATMPLASVFDSWAWLLNGILAVAFVSGAATLARTVRAPAGLQVLAGMGALLLFLTWRFSSGEEIAGLIPTAGTFAHFNELLVDAGDQIRQSAVPVPDYDGLLLLSTAGIGLMAVLVDLAAVGIRRPALAGLPMLALYSVPVAVLPGSASFLSFALACVGFLWLLVSDSVDRVRRFGRRFSGEGRDVDVWEPSPLSAAGRRLGMITIVAAIVLPLAVPAMTPTLLSTFGPAGGPGGGGGGGLAPVTSVDMNALLADNLTLDEVFEMVVVHTTDPSPYYLRLGVAERVDENGFHADLPEGGGLPLSRNLPDRVPAGQAAGGTYDAQVKVTGLSLGLAPTYSTINSIEGLDDNWALDETTDEIYSRTQNIYGSEYGFQYTRRFFDPDELRGAEPVPSNDPQLRGLTQTPDSSYVTDQVREITAGVANNQYDRVRALYEYFGPANGFRYTLSTQEGDSGSAIVDFLRNKRGFCAQYAAALAWLVREAGYPARVAFGFTRGTGRNGVYSLTNYNLHAWTEVYFEGFGWVPFDATPASSIQGAIRPLWAPPIEDNGVSPSAPPPGGGANAPIPGEDPEAAENPQEGQGGDDGAGLSINSWYVIAGAAILALIVTLAAPSLQRRARRRRRLARSGGLIALHPPAPGEEDLVTDPAGVWAAQRDAHEAWAELLDTMIDYGVLVDPAETPRQTATRLDGTTELAPTGRPSTALLARVEERARYAPAPMRITDLDKAVREAREAFADNASWSQRLRVALFPRSVMMQWRLGWYGLVTRVSRRVGRIRDAVLLVEFRERRRR